MVDVEDDATDLVDDDLTVLANDEVGLVKDFDVSGSDLSFLTTFAVLAAGLDELIDPVALLTDLSCNLEFSFPLGLVPEDAVLAPPPTLDLVTTLDDLLFTFLARAESPSEESLEFDSDLSDMVESVLCTI